MAIPAAVRAADHLASAAIRKQVDKILKSAGLLHCRRMQRFLAYTVEETLSGRSSGLKEYAIGLNVYDKPPTFDPRVDSVIRVEANRLRSKLAGYYEGEGREDQVLIWLPKGSYKPHFRLLAAASSAPRRSTPADGEAQRLYLRGRHFLNKRDPKAIDIAIKCFSDAISKEPSYGLALAGLAACYALLAWLEHVGPAEAWGKAELIIRRALREEPSLAEAHTVLACEKALFRWDWEAAESGFRQAIALDETYSTAHHWYAMFCLAPLGRLDEAELEVKRACELEPSSAVVRYHLGRIMYFKRFYHEAVEHFHHAIELNPRLFVAYWALGTAWSQVKAWSEARQAFSAGREVYDCALAVAGLGQLEALCGERNSAIQSLQVLGDLSASCYVSPVSFAALETALGNLDAAFEHLARAVQERSPRLVYLQIDPAFDRLRTDHRFLPLLSSIQL
jgi:tetratricopeptide (TPR) repeat protein